MSSQFSSVWSGRLALVFGAIMAVLIVWLMVRLVWLVVDGPPVDPAPMPPVPRVAPATGGNGDFRWELFGSNLQRPMVVQSAPATRLSLRLKGVVAAGADGYAIIADSQGSDEVYRVGDELPGGARVESIEPRRVLISRDGRTEALELDEAGGSAALASSSRSQPVAQPVQLPGIRGFESAEGVSIASLPDAATTGGINVQELAGAISVMPVSSGGFRVRPGRNATLFATLGLQVNDIVLAVNGQPLESEEAVRGLFADVLRRGEVSITVNRQGREMTLRPDLEEIMGSLE